MYTGSIFVGGKHVLNDGWQEARAPTAMGLDPSTTQRKRHNPTDDNGQTMCVPGKKIGTRCVCSEKSKIRKMKGPLRNRNVMWNNKLYQTVPFIERAEDTQCLHASAVSRSLSPQTRPTENEVSF